MRITRAQLYFFLFFALPVIYFISVPISTGDLAIWIALGKSALEQGALPRSDLFSFLPTSPLVYPVGICLVYAIFYQLGGFLLVSYFHAVVVLLLLALIYISSLGLVKSPWSPRNMALIFFVWCELISGFAERPALIAMIPFLISFLILQKEDELSLADCLVLVGVNVLWVNIHGSWLILSGMFAWRILANAALLSRWRPKEAWAWPGILLSSLSNPFGYRVFGYVLETAEVSRRRGIEEWSFTNLHVYFPQGILFYFLWIAIFLVCFRVWRARGGSKRVLCFLASPYVPLFFVGILSVRNTVFAFLALLPIARQFGALSEHTVSAEDKPSRRKLFASERFNAFLALGVILGGIAFLPGLKPYTGRFLPPEKRAVFDETAPFKIARYLSSGPRGRIFCGWGLGGFFELEQENKVFMDTLNIVFTDAQFADYLRISSASPGWARLLDSYQIQYIVLNEKEDLPLISALKAASTWSIQMKDSGAVLYKRLGWQYGHIAIKSL